MAFFGYCRTRYDEPRRSANDHPGSAAALREQYVVTPFRILAIDGGGIRGVIPTIWLAEIMKTLDNPSPEQCFDLVVGTSTGSLVASAFSLNMKLDECISLYDRFGPIIFTQDALGYYEKWKIFDKFFEPQYPAINLEDSLIKVFSDSTSLKECKVKLLIPAYDTFSRRMFLFKSYDDSTNDLKVWEACKASSSAPTYFPAHIQEIDGIRRPLIDGGVFANNPAILGLAEAIKIMNKDSASEFEEERKIVLISLGTGSLQRRIEASDAEKWGPIQWVRPLIDVLFDGTAELSHMCAQHIVRTENYVRMQVSLSGVSDDLDDATERNLSLLKTIAQDHLQSDDGLRQIDQIIKLLRN
ncbi:patatin-like phospholipase family protein [Rhizobium leguminosarum]|uniref:patatin-like phospholipase family protein n=1 Tax=Rhizobium leguminosarum TaxID=384 RepID=UPI0013E3DCC1|nr:patatin-like phospholipase family protein [Rhizobium leguminosarum]